MESGDASVRIGASLLAADPLALRGEIRSVGGADFLHIDLMDDSFVRGVTWGRPTVEACVAEAPMPVELHLMVSDADQWVSDLVGTGCRRITFHVEAGDDPLATAARIRRSGCLAGLAVSPSTPLASVAGVVGGFDHLLLMTVEPGDGGSPMVPGAVPRARAARRMLDHLGVPVELGVDGGVDATNIGALSAAGVRSVVAGTSVFSDDDRTRSIRRLRAAAGRGGVASMRGSAASGQAGR